MNNFTITFSHDQVNIILKHLSAGRWAEVDGVINHIQSECGAQIEAAKKAAQQLEETAPVSE